MSSFVFSNGVQSRVWHRCLPRVTPAGLSGTDTASLAPHGAQGPAAIPLLKPKPMLDKPGSGAGTGAGGTQHPPGGDATPTRGGRVPNDLRG